MKRLLALLCTLLIGPAVAQQPSQTFSSYVNTLPQATLVNPADQFYLLQGGVSKSISSTNLFASQLPVIGTPLTIGNPATTNSLVLTAGTSGNGAVISVNGIDANTFLNLTTKGSGNVSLVTGNGTAFSAFSNANAVNFLEAFGVGTGGGPSLFATGSDTNISMGFSTKGSGNYNFQSNTFGPNIFQILGTTTAVNNFQIQAAPTGAAPLEQVVGSDTNIGMNFSTKGQGAYIFQSNSAGGSALQVSPSTTPANFIQIDGANTGIAPGLQMLGADTNIGFAATTKGTGTYTFYDNNFSNIIFQITSASSAANYLVVQPANTGSAAVLASTGSDTNVNLTLQTKGNGSFTLGSNNNSNTVFQALGSTTAVNFLQVTPANSGSGPSLTATGTDTNISLVLAGKGTGSPFIAAGTNPAALVFQGSSSGTASINVNAAAGNTVMTIPSTVSGTIHSTGDAASGQLPGNPAGTANTTGVMMGLAGTLTPAISTRAIMGINGVISNNTAGDTCTVKVRFGTGTAPTNGAALTGTVIGSGNGQQFQAPAAGSSTPYSIIAVVTGLTAGTAYWIDASLAANAGTCTITNTTILSFEL